MCTPGRLAARATTLHDRSRRLLSTVLVESGAIKWCVRIHVMCDKTLMISVRVDGDLTPSPPKSSKHQRWACWRPCSPASRRVMVALTSRLGGEGLAHSLRCTLDACVRRARRESPGAAEAGLTRQTERQRGRERERERERQTEAERQREAERERERERERALRARARER